MALAIYLCQQASLTCQPELLMHPLLFLQHLCNIQPDLFPLPLFHLFLLLLPVLPKQPWSQIRGQILLPVKMCIRDRYKADIMEEGDTIRGSGESVTFTIQPQASLTLMDQATGEVKALVGGRRCV